MKRHFALSPVWALLLLSHNLIAQEPIAPAELPTIATACLLGTGILANPLYIKQLKSTNSEDVVMFYDVGKMDPFSDPEAKGILCAQVGIKDELIRIELVEKKSVALTPQVMDLERAVVMATTWATAKGVHLDAYTVNTSRDEKGGIDVLFECAPTRHGGHFGVYVRNNLVVFGKGK